MSFLTPYLETFLFAYFMPLFSTFCTSFLEPGLTRVLNLIVCVPFSIPGFNVIDSVLVVKPGRCQDDIT